MRYGNVPYDTWLDLIDSSIKLGQLIERCLRMPENLEGPCGSAARLRDLEHFCCARWISLRRMSQCLNRNRTTSTLPSTRKPEGRGWLPPRHELVPSNRALKGKTATTRASTQCSNKAFGWGELSLRQGTPRWPNVGPFTSMRSDRTRRGVQPRSSVLGTGRILRSPSEGEEGTAFPVSSRFQLRRRALTTTRRTSPTTKTAEIFEKQNS